MAKGQISRLIKQAVTLLIFIGILGGIGYYIYRYGLKPPPFLNSWFSSSSDAATVTNVKTALGLSSQVSGYDINVAAQDGHVTLTGQAPSQDVRSLAGQIAGNTSGVKEVDNLISVNPDVKRSAASSKVEDLELKAGLARAISQAPDLANKKIDINVENQVVTLSGSVDTAAQRTQAEQIVKGTPGVMGLNNNLSLPSAQPGASPGSDPNTDLAKRVEFELFKSSAFNLQTMKIAADNGAVTLSGTVRNRAEQLLAVRLAQGVDGVKTVSDNLATGTTPTP
ncbi:MAG TPA: BON domain-containing protein [Blastocatellia bacterium]|nr:BON domain-containing protein [Blastocatellia bacterium]